MAPQHRPRSCRRCLRVCGNRTLSVVITTLIRGNHSVRERFVSAIQDLIPTAAIQASVDGTNKQSVADALQQENVPFHRLCYTQGQWGALALFATRYRAFNHQRSDFMLLLEDDVGLRPRFLHAIATLIGAHFCATGRAAQQLCSTNGQRHACFERPVDVLQLGSYGEGYITSRDGAGRLAAKVRRMGIIGCADQQFNVGGLMNLSHAWNRRALPWRLLAPTNAGERAATPPILLSEAAELQRCTGLNRTGPCRMTPSDHDGSRALPPPERPKASTALVVAAAVVLTPLFVCAADAASELGRRAALRARALVEGL